MSTEKKLQLHILEWESKWTSHNQESPILKQSPAYVDDILNSVFSDKTLKEIELYRIEKLKNPQTIPTTEEQRKYTRAQHYINGEIAGFLRDSKKSKLEQSDEEYLKSLMRQMWLKQTSIITLRNEQYIDSFIQDLKFLYQLHPSLLEKYSTQYLPEEVGTIINSRSPEEITHTSNGDIYFLLHYIWIIHANSSSRTADSYKQQNDFTKMIFYKKEEDHTKVIDDNLKKQLIYLDKIESMPDFFKKQHTSLIDQLIKKYGITYINTIRHNAADNLDDNIMELPDEFIDHPELALFYFIEKTFLDTFDKIDEINISIVIEYYQFYKISPNLYFLFLTALIIQGWEIGYNCLLKNFYKLPPESWIYLTQAILYAQNQAEVLWVILDNYGVNSLLELFNKQYRELDKSSPLYILIVWNIYYIQYFTDKNNLKTDDDIEKLMTLADIVEDQYSKNLISPQVDSIYQETLDMLASFYFDTNDIEKWLELLEKKLLSITQKSDIHKIWYRQSRELNVLIVQHERMGNKEKVNQWLQFWIREWYDMTNIKYNTTKLSSFSIDQPSIIH